MDYKQRYKKLRLLFRAVNKKRKQQAKKIDILCNNFIAGQKDFIKKLNTLSFAADFYESILGAVELNDLLHTTSKFIRNEIVDANIAFFLQMEEGFELFLFENDQPVALKKKHLENFFTDELVDNIRKSNRVCTLDDMFAMGLQGNLAVLNKVSAITIPLSEGGLSPGFILVYRTSKNKLTAAELDNISGIIYGLSRAIQSCQMISHSAN